MATFSRPENALKRAEELINVGQKQDALQVLHNLITSKRHRAWHKILESIMKKYVELCVDMQMGRFAKDGLIQFRNVCQQVNIASLEEVIKYFLHLSTEKAEQAHSKAHALEVPLDVDDLEADKSPEELMLSYVSGEKDKDRSEHELVTPCLKFFWEALRTVLDILRNNSKLEALYAMTAHRAFQFCKQYKRRTEFRRLCEIIRNHLANLNKYRDQRDRPDLSNPESLQLYLDTRFEQLKMATELELWQEAFRSVEDIHGLMCMVKKTAKPSLMVVYYAKLTDIFWISDHHLYHAYAWLKLFSLQKKFNKNFSQKHLQLVASAVVLGALSVTPYDHTHGASHVEAENEKARNLRMVKLVGFDLDPRSESGEMLSRSSLLSELVSKGVMSCATQEVKDLFQLLEHGVFHLDILSKVQSLLIKISKVGGKLSSAFSVPEVQLSRYVPALEKLATFRLLQKVSQVYQTIKVESLSKMIPFFDFSVVERISVDAIKHNFIALKIDHDKGIVLFDNVGLESDSLRDRLTNLAESLYKARVLIHPPANKSSKLNEILPGLVETVDKEHKRLLARKLIIEKHKEEQERQVLLMEREEAAKKQKAHKTTKEAEQKRLLAEYEERKRQQLLKAVEEREKENEKPSHEEHEKLIKKKQEKERKFQKLVKTMDYLERAKREESAPLIEVAFQHRLVEGKVLHEQEQQKEIEFSRQRHGDDLKEKNRLTRMVDNKNLFQERVVNRRLAEYNKLRMEREERMNQIINARREERVVKRKIMFYLRSEEERQTKLREEEDAWKREEAERQKKEEAELRAIAEKQRQRELEVEEKERQRRESLLGKSTEPKAAPSVAPYVPKWRRQGEGSGQAPPPAEPDRWGKRQDDHAPQFSDRWRKDDRRSDFGSGSKPSTWSSSKIPIRGGGGSGR